MQGEGAKVRAELDAKFAEIWTIYVDAWKGGTTMPLDPSMFERLLSDEERAKEAIELASYTFVRRQLEKSAAALPEPLSNVLRHPSLIAVVATYAPQRLDGRALVGALRGLNDSPGGEVIAHSCLAAALSRERHEAYAFMRSTFVEVPYNSVVHPTLLVAAAEAGMMLDPSWVTHLVRASHPALRETITAVVVTAVRRGWGDELARELLFGFLDGIDDQEPEPLTVSRPPAVTLSSGPSTEAARPAPAPSAPMADSEMPEINSARFPPIGGTLLLGTAVGDRHLTASEISWAGADRVGEVVRHEAWCTTLAALNGGLPADIPPTPSDFQPWFYTFPDLEQVDADEPLSELPRRAVLIALVPLDGKAISPNEARDKFEAAHKHTLEMHYEG